MQKDTIAITNLVPRFLKFYYLAAAAEPQDRFSLWKEHYGFAAVPPGDEGQQLARTLFETAWERYADAIPYLEKWEPDQEQIDLCIQKVKSALQCDEAMDFTLVFFVGGFESNAFVAPLGDGRSAVCLPVECGDNEIAVVHEMTHLVHSKVSGFSLDWEKSVASLILSEGLATQMCKFILPGQEDSAYVEHTAGWLSQCERNRNSILGGIVPYLSECAPETIYRFTMGMGTTGCVREAYYVGWVVVHELLKQGNSFEDIARIQENDLLDTIEKVIVHVMNSGSEVAL